MGRLVFSTAAGVAGLSALYALLPLDDLRRRLVRRELRLVGVNAKLHPGSAPLPSGPAILVCNHLHAVLDTMMIKVLDPSCSVVMKDDLLTEVPAALKPVVSSFVQTLNVIWYSRGESDSSRTRERILSDLRSGRKVLIFAEGTTQRDGPPQHMFAGSMEIAAEAGCPVVPVAVAYRPASGWTDNETALQNVLAIINRPGGGVQARICCRDRMRVDTSDAKAGIEAIRRQVTEAYYSCIASAEGAEDTGVREEALQQLVTDRAHGRQGRVDAEDEGSTRQDSTAPRSRL